MAQLDAGALFQVIMQPPGVVDHGLENEGFAGGNGGTVAAVNGTRRELRTRHYIRFVNGGPDVGGRRISVARNTLRACPWRGAARRPGPTKGRSRASACPNLKHAMQPLPEFATVVFPHGFIANRRDHLRKPRLKRGTSLRRVKCARLGLPHPQELRERTCRLDDVLDSVTSPCP